MQPADAMWFRSHFAWQRERVSGLTAYHGNGMAWTGLVDIKLTQPARSNCLACAGVSGRRGRKAALPLDAIILVLDRSLADMEMGLLAGWSKRRRWPVFLFVFFLSLPLGEISVLVLAGIREGLTRQR